MREAQARRDLGGFLLRVTEGRPGVTWRQCCRGRKGWGPCWDRNSASWGHEEEEEEGIWLLDLVVDMKEWNRPLRLID